DATSNRGRGDAVPNGRVAQGTAIRQRARPGIACGDATSRGANEGGSLSRVGVVAHVGRWRTEVVIMAIEKPRHALVMLDQSALQFGPSRVLHAGGAGGVERGRGRALEVRHALRGR